MRIDFYREGCFFSQKPTAKLFPMSISSDIKCHPRLWPTLRKYEKCMAFFEENIRKTPIGAKRMDFFFWKVQLLWQGLILHAKHVQIFFSSWILFILKQGDTLCRPREISANTVYPLIFLFLFAFFWSMRAVKLSTGFCWMCTFCGIYAQFPETTYRMQKMQ